MLFQCVCSSLVITSLSLTFAVIIQLESPWLVRPFIWRNPFLPAFYFAATCVQTTSSRGQPSQHPAASVEQVTACTCLPALAPSAGTIPPTCWWISSCQCSLVQVKASQASWGGLEMLFNWSKVRSVNHSVCRSWCWQSAAGGGWWVLGVSNLSHWHSWVWDRMSTHSLLTQQKATSPN